MCKHDSFVEQILTILSNWASFYTEILHNCANLSKKRLNFTKLHLLPDFLPQPANIFTRIYSSYSWHLATLMIWRWISSSKLDSQHVPSSWWRGRQGQGWDNHLSKSICVNPQYVMNDMKIIIIIKDWWSYDHDHSTLFKPPIYSK